MNMCYNILLCLAIFFTFFLCFFFLFFFCSLCTGITNSNGVASFTLTGLTTSATYTCSYSNVSDTCTVTVAPTYLFYDACDSAIRLSNYGTPIKSYKGSASGSITYDSTENAYALQGSGSYHILIPITPLNDVDDYELSFEFKHMKTYNSVDSAHCQPSIFIYDKTVTSYPSANGLRYRADGLIQCQHFGYNSDNSYNNVTYTTGIGTSYFTLIMRKSGTDLSFIVKNSDGTIIYDYAYPNNNIDGTACAFGVWTERGTSYGYYVKNIKAEPI